MRYDWAPAGVLVAKTLVRQCAAVQLSSHCHGIGTSLSSISNITPSWCCILHGTCLQESTWQGEPHAPTPLIGEPKQVLQVTACWVPCAPSAVNSALLSLPSWLLLPLLLLGACQPTQVPSAFCCCCCCALPLGLLPYPCRTPAHCGKPSCAPQPAHPTVNGG
jgi:hypothetical protein